MANSGSPSSDDVDDNTLLQRNIQRLIQAFASRTSKQSSDSDKGGASKSKAGGIDDAPPHQAAPWLGSGGGGGVLASAFRTALSKLRPAATSSVNDSGGDSQQSNATVSLNGTAGVVIPPAAVAGGLLQLAQTPGKPLFAGAGDRGSVAAAEGSIPGGGRLLKFFSLKQQLAGLSVRLTELESALRDAYYARARWEAQRVVDKAYGLRRGLDITALRDAVRQAFDYQCEPSEFVPPAPQNATILGE